MIYVNSIAQNGWRGTQKEVNHMEPIPRLRLPKRDYTLAAECQVDFDEIVERLKPSVKRGTFDDGLVFRKRYRYICLRLSTGRFATLTQTEMDTTTVEVGLEIKDDEFFHEADLLEILKALGIAKAKCLRMQGDFTWIPVAAPKKERRPT